MALVFNVITMIECVILQEIVQNTTSVKMSGHIRSITQFLAKLHIQS